VGCALVSMGVLWYVVSPDGDELTSTREDEEELVRSNKKGVRPRPAWKSKRRGFNREFMLRSRRGRMQGDFLINNLCDQRIDLVCRTVSAALFLSRGTRRDTSISIAFEGSEQAVVLNVDGDKVRHLRPDERNIAAFIQKALHRFGLSMSSDDSFQEVDPKYKCLKGFTVTEGGLIEWVKATRTAPVLFLLDENGIPLEEWLGKPGNADAIRDKGVKAVLGDDWDLKVCQIDLLQQQGAIPISLGSVPLLSSHCIILLHHFLDMI